MSYDSMKCDICSVIKFVISSRMSEDVIIMFVQTAFWSNVISTHTWVRSVAGAQS
jgi:hypothetical protein